MRSFDRAAAHSTNKHSRRLFLYRPMQKLIGSLFSDPCPTDSQAFQHRLLDHIVY